MSEPLAKYAEELDFLTEQLQGSTLTAPEAVRMASRWWDNTGRNIISKIFNTEIVGGSARGPGLNGAPAIKVSGNREVTLPSKLLQGHPWEDLDRRERAAVVKAWVSQYRAIYAPGRIVSARH